MFGFHLLLTFFKLPAIIHTLLFYYCFYYTKIAERSWLVSWCSGYHVCFTRRRSRVQTPEKPNFYFFKHDHSFLLKACIKQKLLIGECFKGFFLRKGGYSEYLPAIPFYSVEEGITAICYLWFQQNATCVLFPRFARLL